MNKITALALAALFVFAAGCRKSGTTVASIGRDKISSAMLAERIQEAPPAYQSYLTTAAGKKQFLDLMVRERLVVEAARQAGISRKKEYTAAMAEFKKEQDRRMKDYEENLLMELYVKDLYSKEIGASDKEVNAYYTEHEDEFIHPREIMARHVLVPSREEAEKVAARLKKGEDFGKIAREVSTDPISAVRGGEIGPFRRGDLVPEFEKAVFALKTGEVSGIVETQFGFHIIKKTSEKALTPQPAEETKAEIKKILEKTKFDAWMEKAKKRYNVKVDYNALSAIQPAQGTDAPAPEAGTVVPSVTVTK